MENGDTSTILPALDEHDVMAIETILIRTIRAQDQSNRDRDLIKALNARIATNTRICDSAYASLKVFGFEAPVQPEGSEPVNLWSLVRAVIGNEKYDRAIAVARGAQMPELLSQMGVEEQPQEKAKPQARPPVSIRTAVLEYLRSSPNGATAREVRQHLLSAHGIETHEKTPGMTLYRLLKDEKARREGRRWFYVETDEEPETNAGADLA